MKKILFAGLLWPLMAYAEQPGLLLQFESALVGGNALLPVLLAISAGFLTALSPCVYPLIPITLSVMGARKYESPLQGFLVSLSYTLGMAAIYSTLGIIFASVGRMTGSLMQRPEALLIIALIFFLMALSSLGLFSLSLPEKWSSKLGQLGGQGIKGAFLMGLVAGLLAAPCTGPVLGVILTIIAEKRDILWGLTLMLSFSLGMGLPFLLLGTFSSALLHLPKSGVWMEKVKKILGALMLSVAFYYLQLAFPETIILKKQVGALVWLVLLTGLIFMSINMFNSPMIHRLQLSLGVAMISFSVASMLSLEEPMTHEVEELSWQLINEKTKDPSLFERLLKQAQAQKLPVLIDFYADWCKACKELEHDTFMNPSVSKLLHQFFLIRIDSTKGSEILSAIQNHFQVVGLPTVILIDAQGHKSEKIVGISPVDQFLPLIKGMLQ